VRAWTPRREQHRLRYITARYAAFPNLFLWTIANEYETHPDGRYHFDQPDDPDWARATARFIKQHNPYQHLVTVHPAVSALAQGPDLDRQAGTDHLKQFMLLEWLADVRVQAGFQYLLPHIVKDTSRDGHDGCLASFVGCLDVPTGLVSIHYRHAHVHEDEVRFPSFKARKCLGCSIASGPDGASWIATATRKQLPLPTSLVTVIWPPINRANRWLIAKPSP
jgi:hypothetical protein